MTRCACENNSEPCYFSFQPYFSSIIGLIFHSLIVHCARPKIIFIYLEIPSHTILRIPSNFQRIHHYLFTAAITIRMIFQLLSVIYQHTSLSYRIICNTSDSFSSITIQQPWHSPSAFLLIQPPHISFSILQPCFYSFLASFFIFSHIVQLHSL